MSKIRGKNTEPELTLGKAMWSLGLRYRKHYPITGKPDFVLVKTRIVVFSDGDFWHGHNWRLRGLKDYKSEFRKNRKFWINKIKRNMERDKKVNAELRRRGWKVMRFWASDIKRNPERCAKKVLKAHMGRLPKN